MQKLTSDTYEVTRTRKCCTVLAAVFLLTGLTFTFWSPIRLSSRPQRLKSRVFTDSVQRHRKVQLQTVCNHRLGFQTRNFTFQEDYWIRVDEKRNLIFCMIPKVASIFFRRLLYGKFHFKLDTKPISNFTTGKRETMLKEYLKVIFVRHPLDRLWAAYIEKFVGYMPKYILKDGVKIIQRYRDNPDDKTSSCAHDVTFSEFVRYIVDNEQIGIAHDHHWLPYYNLCKPCEIKYDIIGKLKTLRSDLKTLRLHTEIPEVPLHEDLKYIFDARCREFYHRGPHIEGCTNIQDTFIRRWKAWKYAGLVDPMAPLPPIPKYLKTQPERGSLWKRFCVETIRREYSRVKNITIFRKLIAQRKERVKIKAFSAISEDIKRNLIEIYRFDMSLFGYEQYV